MSEIKPEHVVELLTVLDGATEVRTRQLIVNPDVWEVRYRKDYVDHAATITLRSEEQS